VDSLELSFHPAAANRFDERTRDILPTVQGLRPVPNPLPKAPDVHPVDTIRSEDIISGSKVRVLNSILSAIHRVVWVSGTMHVGWVGPAFEPIKALVRVCRRNENPSRNSSPLSSCLKQICEWLCDTLERRRSDTLSTFIAQRSNEAIREHDIWIPLFQTYSSRSF